MRGIFFSKYTFPSSCSFFFVSKNLLGLRHKNLTVKIERNSLEILLFDTHSTANVPLFVISKIFKLFQKKSNFSSKKTYLQPLKNFHFFSRFLRQFCYSLGIKKVFKGIYCPKSEIGIKVRKKRSMSAFRLDDFPSILYLWTENDKIRSF